jgi:putative DNA primase/helicase
VEKMKETKKYINKSSLEDRIQGEWLAILAHLAPELEEAINSMPRHVPCCLHDGVNGDGFRFFSDANETGFSICNTCGAFSPYSLLIAINGWTFYQTLKKIDKYLTSKGR